MTVYEIRDRYGSTNSFATAKNRVVYFTLPHDASPFLDAKDSYYLVDSHCPQHDGYTYVNICARIQNEKDGTGLDVYAGECSGCRLLFVIDREYNLSPRVSYSPDKLNVMVENVDDIEKYLEEPWNTDINRQSWDFDITINKIQKEVSSRKKNLVNISRMDHFINKLSNLLDEAIEIRDEQKELG